MSAPGRIEAFPGLRVLAPVVAAITFAGAAAIDPGPLGSTFIAAGAVVGFVVWAIWPRVGTLPFALAVTATIVLALRCDDLEPAMFMLSMAATIVGSCERSKLRLAIAAVVLGAAPSVLSYLFDAELSTGIWTGGVLLPLVLTWISKRQAALTLELAETRAALADQLVAEERRRIARDVHDSVGHGLAAMLLHITGARHVLRRDVDSADQALIEAEAVGRRSMLELRQTLGLLRTQSGLAPAPPIPGTTQLAALGVDIVGEVDRIDPLVGLSLHRVAEEALANVRQHSIGPATLARLAIDEDRAVLTIESRGHAAPPGSGDQLAHYGIVGMSERMAAVGGELRAGPTADGWIVQASAPLTAFPGHAGRTEPLPRGRSVARNVERDRS